MRKGWSALTDTRRGRRRIRREVRAAFMLLLSLVSWSLQEPRVIRVESVKPWQSALQNTGNQTKYSGSQLSRQTFSKS